MMTDGMITTAALDSGGPEVGVRSLGRMGVSFACGPVNADADQDLTADDFRRRMPRFTGEEAADAALLAPVRTVADAHGATLGQITPARVRQRAAVHGLPVVPIPGTRKPARVEENTAATRITLTDTELARPDPIAAKVAGARCAGRAQTSAGREQLSRAAADAGDRDAVKAASAPFDIGRDHQVPGESADLDGVQEWICRAVEGNKGHRAKALLTPGARPTDLLTFQRTHRGHQNPDDRGLGFGIRDSKSPHWTGSSSPRAFGHFGQSGTFPWVAPDAGAACAALTGRAFDPWAIEAWPPFTDAVPTELHG